VLELTGKSIVEQQKSHHFRDNPYECRKIGLMTERDHLYARIEQRTEKMMENGFTDEVRNILNMGYEETIKPMQSLGYKQMLGYLRGEYSLGEAVRRIKRDTRRYAKRQLTWFKADKDIEWFSPHRIKTWPKAH
jgi:tRNA dimethylallyltransferase